MLFGEAGSLVMTKSQSIVFENAKLAVSQGVMAIATTDGFEKSVVRLIAVDYQGKPLDELGPDGIRDYELAEFGEHVEDVEFCPRRLAVVSVYGARPARSNWQSHSA